MLENLVRKLSWIVAPLFAASSLSCAHVKLKNNIDDEENYAEHVKFQSRTVDARKALGEPDGEFAEIKSRDYYWRNDESIYRKSGYIILKLDKPIVTSEGDGPDLRVVASEHGSYMIESRGKDKIGQDSWRDDHWIYLGEGRGTLEVETYLDLTYEIKIISIGEVQVYLDGIEEI